MRRRALFLLLIFFVSVSSHAASGLSGAAARIAEFLKDSPRQQRPEMIADPLLTRVAMQRARDMAQNGYFSHVNQHGEGPNYLVARAGYPLSPMLLGNRRLNTLESICAGQSTPEAAWQSWMKSRPHRMHLLGLRSFYAEQTRYGVGVVYDPASPLKYYYVVITAPPPSAAQTEGPMWGRRTVQPWFGAMR